MSLITVLSWQRATSCTVATGWQASCHKTACVGWSAHCYPLRYLQAGKAAENKDLVGCVENELGLREFVEGQVCCNVPIPLHSTSLPVSLFQQPAVAQYLRILRSKPK